MLNHASHVNNKRMDAKHDEKSKESSGDKWGWIHSDPFVPEVGKTVDQMDSEDMKKYLQF